MEQNNTTAENIMEEEFKHLNESYRSKGMPPRQRPFQAIMDISKAHNCSIKIPSPAADKIFEWFKEHTKPGAHALGPIFTGAYFFDACFWPVTVPIGYGSFHLNALDALESMPLVLKQELLGRYADLWEYILYWTDCIDYGYGIDEVLKSKRLSARSISFLENGHSELDGTVAQLTVQRPVPKAILSARMTCEIFLKALLIQEKSLSNTELKKISHRIPDLAKEAFSAVPLPEFKLIESKAAIYPDVSVRYDGDERPLNEVWQALSLAQISATTVVRHYSGRDMRPQIFRGQ